MNTNKKHQTNARGWGILLTLTAALLLTPLIPAHAAGLLIAEGGFGGVLEIQEHSVDTVINNGVAVTTVDQVFLNTENRQVEALYTFPVPKGASVANFSMWINGKEMTGEVVEKERAREIYNSYKQQKRDPGLLEQVDYKTFEMRIFPIPANAEQRVQVSYYQELNVDHDWATYVYPLATTTKAQADTRVHGRFAMTLRVLSEVPIVEMESPSHAADFIVAQHGEELFEASLELAGGDLAKDIVLNYHLSRPRTGIDIITSKENNEDGFFCMTITVGEELSKEQKGMDYVFVLDVSGSMGAERKLATSSQAIQAFIDALGKEDRFEVMSFNLQPELLFSDLVPVNADNLQTAQDFLNSQRAQGGTVLPPAMQTAYKYADTAGDRALNVVLLSDGLTEQKDRPELLRIINARPANARVFCVGVGNDVNRALLDQMAEESGGLAAHISRGDNFQRAAQAFQRKLTRPVASDLELAFLNTEVYDIVPQRLPNLFHGTPVRLYGRYRGSGPAEITFSADVSGYELKQTAKVELPDTDPENPEIERMWAWHRVQELQKEGDRVGSRANVTDEIIRLGEGFSIVTEYTSFLVLENNEEYQRWKIERRNALRTERDRRSQQALRDRIDALRDANLDQMGPTAVAKRKEADRIEIAKAPQPGVTPNNTTPPPRPNNTSNQNFDFNMPRGGGAIDPISGSIALGLAGLAYASRRKKKKD